MLCVVLVAYQLRLAVVYQALVVQKAAQKEEVRSCPCVCVYMCVCVCGGRGDRGAVGWWGMHVCLFLCLSGFQH